MFNKFTLLSAALLLVLSSSSQEIDQSIIDNLSKAQLDQAKQLLSDNIVDQNINPETEKINAEESLENKLNEEVTEISEYRFGYNFISSSPTSIVASTDLPLPNDYKISLGDLLGVVLSGSKEQMFDMKVQLDGTVFFPELGAISVVGETFESVKYKLKNLVDQSYIGVDIDLSLKELSAKKITIVGAVNNPGTYLVNPFTTISNALAYSGGVQEIGSLRTIKLVKPSGDYFFFDLYDLLIKGDRTKDLTIDSGDVIMVGASKRFIEITGEIKRPGLYEILEGEDLSNLINFALGFTDKANKENITLKELDPYKNVLSTVITKNIYYKLDNIDSIAVFPLINNVSADIEVSGAISEPGFYDLEEFNTLEKLIKSLNFVDVYPWMAVLEQFDENNLIKSSILFNLNDPSTYKSIKLLPNSKVHFANVDTISFPVEDLTKLKIDDYSLKINHKDNTYLYPVIGNFKVISFIDFIGLDMSDVDKTAIYISPLENIVVKDNYLNMEFEANKYHTVSFRSPINDLIQVTISGEIDYPGTYTLKPDSTIEDLYEMSGGFKKEAFISGIIFLRESVRSRQLDSISKSRNDLNKSLLIMSQKDENIGDINIIRSLAEDIEPQYLGRIAGNFAPGSLSTMNTLLFTGDEIIIPKNPNVISVLGEVLNPISFKYQEGTSIDEAINTAGGYNETAKKDSVYVIKASGIIKKARRNIFVRNIKLEPGDTIVVPRRIITNNPGIDALLPITQILSDLAFSAAAIESLANN